MTKRERLLKWIIAVLTNDEVSTNDELVEYFLKEGQMTKDEADYWVSRRGYYINRI